MTVIAYDARGHDRRKCGFRNSKLSCAARGALAASLAIVLAACASGDDAALARREIGGRDRRADGPHRRRRGAWAHHLQTVRRRTHDGGRCRRLFRGPVPDRDSHDADLHVAERIQRGTALRVAGRHGAGGRPHPHVGTRHGDVGGAGPGSHLDRARRASKASPSCCTRVSSARSTRLPVSSTTGSRAA